MKKEYKFKSSFSAQIKPLVSKELDKYLSVAAETNFRKFLPKDINFEEKIDFLGFAGEAFIGNRLNLNDDGVSTEESIRIANLFPMSFIDVDHDRSRVAGVITNASYAEFGTGKELTLEEVKNTKSPFSVVVGGVIWRIPNPSFADAIEESADPNSEHHNKFFLSWEILFSNSKLIIMDKNKSNFEDGKIISDAGEISQLESKLKAFGGTGYTEDGKRIGRVIIEDCIPTAVGIVESPAATVKPISIASETQKISANSSESVDYECPHCGEKLDMSSKNAYYLEDEEEIECAKCKEKSMGKKWRVKANIIKDYTKGGIIEVDKNIELLPENERIIKKSEISNSQSPNLNVNANTNIDKNTKTNDKTNKIMIIKSYKDLTDENLKEAKASDINTLLDLEVKKISDKFVEDKNKLDESIKASESKAKEIEEKYSKAQEQLTKVQEDLQKLIKANEDREKEEIFSNRMNYFDAEFDLDEKSRNAVANRIKNLDEAGYKTEKEDLEVLLVAKKKSGKVFDKKTMKWVDPEDLKDGGKDENTEDKDGKKKAAKASVKTEEEVKTDVVSEAIDNGEKTKTTVAATTTVAETQSQKFVKAFGIESWEVDNHKLRK